MYYEYAVEPRAIGSSWTACKYLIEQFGFDKGRLISQFPKRWFKEAYEAADGLGAIEKARIEVALRQARDKNRVVRSGRPYDPIAGDWLFNAVAENFRLPFRAIIATTNPDGNESVLVADDVDETQPLMNVPQDRAVPRDALALSEAMKEMLRLSSHVLFVDPFFDPFKARYKSTMRECLRIVGLENAGAVCEVHYRHQVGTPTPAPDAIRRGAANLFPGLIPAGVKVTFFGWREKAGGADFHARYLLTDKGGIGIDAGFSAEGSHQTTDMRLMSFELSQEKLKSFARNATDYELVEPIVRVAADGRVENI